MPVPADANAPGYLVNVHVPVAGNPFKATLPVGEKHVGGVIVPTAGAPGLPGCMLITTDAEAPEVQPDELDTINEYDPASKPVIVVLVPVPVAFTVPGLRVNVHVPDSGSKFNITLPKDSVHDF